MGDFQLFGLPISIGTMIYQAILFTILVFIFKKFFLKKLVQALDNRKQTIENQLMLAEKQEQEAEALRKEQEELLMKARIESKHIIEESRKEAREVIRDARKEAMKIRSEAYAERVKRAVEQREKEIC